MKKAVSIGIVTACACPLAQGAIVSVSESGLAGDTPAIIENGAFGEDVLTFSDRTHQHNGAAFDAGSGLLSTAVGSNGVGGSNMIALVGVPVPEPSSATLVGLGLLGLLRRRR